MAERTQSTGVPEAAVEAVLARRAAEGAEVEDADGRKAIWTVLRPTVEADLRAAYLHLLADFKEKLLSNEAKQVAAATWDQAHAEKMARFMQSVRPGEVAQPMENSDIAEAALEAAFNKATEQADGGEMQCSACSATCSYTPLGICGDCQQAEDRKAAHQ